MNEHENKLVRKPSQETIAAPTEDGDRIQVERARRYEIDTIIRYRVRGENEWREGMMKNISNSGVLIHTAHSLPLDTTLEMRFSLPIQLRGEFAAEVLCRGSVVRFAKSEAPGEALLVAARINHSRFLRQKDRAAESLKPISIDDVRRMD